jgi:hypothetical protein
VVSTASAGSLVVQVLSTFLERTIVLPTERQLAAARTATRPLFFLLGPALEVGAVCPLVCLDVLELAALVANGIELGAFRAAMRSALGHDLPLVKPRLRSTLELYGVSGVPAILVLRHQDLKLLVSRV